MSNVPHTGGIFNMSGARPENAFKFDGPVFPKQVCYFFKFTSTHDAIEKHIIPPPLKVDRTQPPEVICWYFASANSKGPGGQHVAYQGFNFRGHVDHKGTKGVAGWEFVDGLRGDKTTADAMGPWSVHFGMIEKFGNIHFTPIGGNEFEITITRHGSQVLRMTICSGQEIDEATLASFSGSGDPMSLPTLTVREIPSADWSGYLDRSILKVPTTTSTRMRRAWEAKDATIEFGQEGLNNLDDLSESKPAYVQALMISEMEVGKDKFTNLTVLETL